MHGSSSFQQKPNYISDTHDGQFECDDKRPAFQQIHICSHYVAVAKDNGVLKEFLDKYGIYARTAKGIVNQYIQTLHAF